MANSGRVFLDCFSGSLGELPKGKRTTLDALRVLADDPRVSTFERGPAWLEAMISDLLNGGLVVERVADRGPRVGDAGQRPLRVDDARPDRQVLEEEVLAVEHDARRRVGVDRDDVLARAGAGVETGAAATGSVTAGWGSAGALTTPVGA